MRPFIKIFTVIVTSVVLTTLGINASDSLSGNNGNLLGQIIGSGSNEICPEGMIEVPSALTFTCVDKFEASPSVDCPVAVVESAQDSESNIAISLCKPVSKEGVLPWVFVNRIDAQLLCARAGKRLPSPHEWYQFSLGTPDNTASCNISSSKYNKTGSHKACVSASDAFDAVGNVWEWTTGDVYDGKFEDKDLPAEGYVTSVDSEGMVTASSLDIEESLSGDYFWSKSEGSFAIMRGGFYGSKSDAGVFAVHAVTAPKFTGGAIGFRCVQ